MLSQQTIDLALELFNDVGPMTTRKMFGGMGIYSDGQIFAIIMSDETIMLKGQGAMMEKFDDLGMERWTYTRKNSDTISAMPYWALNDDMLDDPERASALAREAIGYL